MAQFVPSSDTARPSVRRKSSAQNLLSSAFKRTDSGLAIAGSATGATSPTPPNGLPPSSYHPPSTSAAAYVGAGAPTPTTATPRDWEAQSTIADSVISGTSTITGSTSLVGVPAQSPAIPAAGTGTTLEFLRDLVQKRMVTLTYMRNVHDGRSHWFHTIMMTRADLDRVFNNVAMKKRTYRFAVLGMSLSNLFDFQSLPDVFLRGLLNTLTEYEQSREEGERPKMGRLFNRGRAGKRPLGTSDYAMSYAESDTSYLATPHMPFPLDYHQTLLSLLDVLSETYHKLSKILGPSPFPSSAYADGLPRSMHPQVMAGPLGAISPKPGVSYLFSTGVPGVPGVAGGAMGTDEFGAALEGSSLWGIANGHAVPGSAGGLAGANQLGPVPGSAWTPAIGEMVVKIDGKLKKIITTLLKELDEFARNAIKDELSTLDPLLRNLAVSENGGGQEGFDSEGAV